MGLTPMMQQFLSLKEEYKDCILFFRLGDFYEMFFDDALLASKELEITLTARDCGLEQKAPMCGVPFHSCENYINKLISKGHKVAICEQVEDVSQAKGIVKRDVVRVLTPGTLTEGSILSQNENNYLMSIYFTGNVGLSIVDISTGELKVSSIYYGDCLVKLCDEVAKFSPSELIVNKSLYENSQFYDFVTKKLNIYITLLEDEYFEINSSREIVRTKFGEDIITNKTGFDNTWVNSLGALLAYLDKTSKVDLLHIKQIKKYDVEGYMSIDAQSRKNLELTQTIRERTKKASLLWVLDKTKTSMGARLLKQWVEQPLINVNDINKRIDAVEELKEKYMERVEIKELLDKVYDLERLISKVVLGSANCRDLISLKTSIQNIPSIKEVIKDLEADLLSNIFDKMDSLDDLYKLIDSAIIDEPPVTIKEGGIIKDGFSSEVDKLRKASTEGKSWILEIERKEREKTGIKNLKTSFNKVFGYYFEVTKSNYNLVPDYFLRKQTLANCERFITTELKEVEETVLGAEDKLKQLEYDLFLNLREQILLHVGAVKNTAISIATLDCLSNFAQIAEDENYIKPLIDEGDLLEIKDGRHPVVEKMMSGVDFVPNDTMLDLDENLISIITGPNMAGKSTYMRQVAVIVLMSQMGCFVPASYAKIGVVDKIFTRVGASDDLAGGQSTFMVEMSEVSNILQGATKRSLVILDEIGRGTSTYDGLSIAWAVIEYISTKSKIGARTLFATHYHELTELEEKLVGVKNYCITIREKGEDIIFLRKIKRGGADGSFGIQVAKLAGVPSSVITRAKEILNELEEADIAKLEKKWKKKVKDIDGQIDLFSANSLCQNEQEVIKLLGETVLTSLTPIDALNMLYDLQQKLRR